MKGLLSANVRHHGRRYVATGLAVAIAVIFVVMVLAFGNSTGAAIKQIFTQQYEGASAIVTLKSDGGELSSEDGVLAAVEDLPEVAVVSPVVQIWTEFNGGTSQGSLSQLQPEPFFQPTVTEGALPTAADEVALDARTAAALEVGVGDEISVTSTESASLKVVGIYGQTGNSLMSMSPDSGTITPDGVAALEKDPFVATYLVSAAPSVSEEDLAGALQKALGDDSSFEALTITEAMDRAMDDVNLSVAQMNTMLMVFPAIAIVVAIIVISTTFQVIVQQRQRELALLRCIGASGKQVRRLIIGETLAVGAVASLIGVIVGALLGALAISGVGMLPTFGQALAAIGWPTMVGVFLAGILITVVAGFRPAARVAKIPPLAALSPVSSQTSTRSAGWWVRLVLGGVAAAGAGVLMVLISTSHTAGSFVGSIGLGLIALFGLVLFLSAVFPQVVAAVASPLRGMLGRMAAGNAIRNPGRTAATGVSVMIGVTLIVMMMVGASSLRATMNAKLDDHMATDLVVSNKEGQPMTDEGAAAIEKVSGIAAVAIERGLTDGVTLDGNPVTAYDMDAAATVARTDLTLPGANEVFVVSDGEQKDGDTAELCGASGCRQVTLRIDESWTGSFDRVGVNQQLLSELGGTPQALQVLARLNNPADYQIVSADISRLNSSYELGGAAQMRAMFDQVINVMLTVVVALLGVSVLVSLVGVSNTLSLSVAERTRENGLLRALGMTRRQVSRMLTIEAIIISLTAALMGVIAGVFFGWVGMRALPMEELKDFQLVVPPLQVGAVLLVAVLAAVVASWLPGRRAGRTSPVEALAAE